MPTDSNDSPSSRTDTQEAEEFLALQARRDELQQEIGKLQAQREDNERRLTQFAQEVEQKRKEIAREERQELQAQSRRRRTELARALRSTFTAYRAEQRRLKRQQIEADVNVHFQRLMSGHRLVSRLEITEEFDLLLHSVDGPVGMSSISHGMRQLAVSALLWALKDASGHQLPIIVDTPLARIDRANQDNLLSQYYPDAAHQVILLATDSEIDERKYKMIRPNIYRQFILKNDTGEDADFEQLPAISSVES